MTLRNLPRPLAAALLMSHATALAAVVLRGVTLAAVMALAGCFLLPQEERILAPPLLATPEISYRVIEAEPGVIEDRVTVGGVFI